MSPSRKSLDCFTIPSSVLPACQPASLPAKERVCDPGGIGHGRHSRYHRHATLECSIPSVEPLITSSIHTEIRSTPASLLSFACCLLPIAYCLVPAVLCLLFVVGVGRVGMQRDDLGVPEDSLRRMLVAEAEGVVATHAGAEAGWDEVEVTAAGGRSNARRAYESKGPS